MQTWPTASTYNCWYISICGRKNRLIFFYHGYPKNLPQEDESTHVVDLGLPNPPTYLSWQPETLNFYKNWTKKFPETDTIKKLMLISYEYDGGPGVGQEAQKVQWDDFVFESTRPDSDAAVTDINFSGSPKAKIENKGAVVVSFPTVCDIFKGGNKVYSDTVGVDSLAVDSTKEISFKPYSDSSEMKIYTALPGDQNPSNDTLSKNLGIQEAGHWKQTAFQVWPVFTRGMVNYESDKPVFVCDPTGRALIKTEKGRGKLLFIDSGIYFLKSGSDVKKVVRIK